MMTIGEKIKTVRGKKTRKEFLEELHCDMDPHHLYKIEAGIRNATVDLIKLIVDKYNLTMDYFYADTFEGMKQPKELNKLDDSYLKVAKKMELSKIPPEKWDMIVSSILSAEKEDNQG